MLYYSNCEKGGSYENCYSNHLLGRSRQFFGGNNRLVRSHSFPPWLYPMGSNKRSLDLSIVRNHPYSNGEKVAFITIGAGNSRPLLGSHD
jgi:hypothetical protein